MRFYEYRDIRGRLRDNDQGNVELGLKAKRLPLDAFLGFYIDYMTKLYQQFSASSPQKDVAKRNFLSAVDELAWLEIHRPYVNVYPVIEDVIASIKLDVKWEDIKWPYPTMLFRFATESENNWETALMSVTDVKNIDASDSSIDFARQLGTSMEEIQQSKIGIIGSIRIGSDDFTTYISSRKDEAYVSDTIDRISRSNKSSVWEATGERIARLAVFTALVWEDPDLVSPLLSESLRQKVIGKSYDAKQALLEKAARHSGWGFDLGKKLQEERDVTPHWRMPHAAIYHTGKGGMTPKVIFRKGSLVKHQHGLQVPTGFLGPETEEEKQYVEAVCARVPLKPKERWFVLKRDNFTCQVCGAKAKDGVKLEIDHKQAVANGGTNDFDNLWVLCIQCNRGKGTDCL